jgi:hypothetical protein
MNKLVSWLRDKYLWLKTFNKIPTVVINATEIYSNKNAPILVADERVLVTVNSDQLKRDGIENTDENPYTIQKDFVQKSHRMPCVERKLQELRKQGRFK